MKAINKVLIIGSGPIIIGQAAEFDYSGTQACLALKEEGVSSVLVNSNPATIQTDHEIADTVYIEPLTQFFLKKIIAKEKPDGLIATVGGQTALNLATDLYNLGILEQFKVKVLGTNSYSINLGEDRGKFKSLMEKISQPVLSSKAVSNFNEGINFSKTIGFPLVLRSAYNLGGTGSGIANNEQELKRMLKNSLNSSTIKQVLIEKSVTGWAEIEYEIVRDNRGNKIMICNMENIDPMGVHTGESIVVAPSQTLSDDDHQILRTAAFTIVDALNIKGSCNIQFALNQKTGQYFVIEVNPRLSRSSALASKATGYPIAKIAAKIALGKNLPEIVNDMTDKTAFFEPTLDYVVVKIPKWPDDKFINLDKTIGITMKSTGEVMAVGRNFEETMFKAIMSLDLKQNLFDSLNYLPKREILNLLKIPNTQRLAAIFAAFNKGIKNDQISKLTQINPWFIFKLNNLYQNHNKILKDINVFKMVDTCAGEFAAVTPYFYSTHGLENEAKSLASPKVIILGSGPIKIGQGIEFDYLTVHGIKALREKGIKAIIINNNPETVSTDYVISDRLYFEPLTPDFVLKIIHNEKLNLLGVIPQFGGQTAINLVETLQAKNIPILGTSAYSIELAENREKTAQIVESLGYRVPHWKSALTKKEILTQAKSLGFPVLVRPSFVLAGEGMFIAKNEQDILSYLMTIKNKVFEKPVLIDKFIDNALEVDIDFISDGQNTLSFILEQLEPTGIHSGDSSCVYPPQKLDKDVQTKLHEITHNISLAFKIMGIANLQVAIKDKQIYILEINPRASRTVPFLSKCLGISLAKIATKVILGDKLPKNLSIQNKLIAIKKPVFSTEKLVGLSNELSPLMKSTGEQMSIGKSFEESLLKTRVDKEFFGNINIYKLQ